MPECEAVYPLQTPMCDRVHCAGWDDYWLPALHAFVHRLSEFPAFQGVHAQRELLERTLDILSTM